MRFRGVCYRGHDPRWAFTPLSGEGARLKGGRFNRPGQPALYLALTLEGLFVELGHGFARRFEPLTVCSYDIDAADIVDLRSDAGRRRAKAPLDVLGCAWALDKAEGREPPSWALANRLIADGAAGILIPSFANGASAAHCNLVLWTWGAEPPHRVTLYDPASRLRR